MSSSPRFFDKSVKHISNHFLYLSRKETSKKDLNNQVKIMKSNNQIIQRLCRLTVKVSIVLCTVFLVFSTLSFYEIYSEEKAELTSLRR